MKNLKAILFLFCLSCSTLVFSQVKDKENKSIRIPAVKSEKEQDSTPQKIKVAPKLEKEKSQSGDNMFNGINLNGIQKYSLEREKKPFSMLEDDGLKSPGEIYEKRWNKEAEKGGIIRTMSDQFLGEYRVDTKFVNIVCRDHEYPDGDRVQVVVNDVIIYPNVTLTSSYRRLQVNLADGRNNIDIVALNQGESGPNTAEFVVYDDKGNLVSSKEWNLLTGVKAKITFINEKVVIKEKNQTIASKEDSRDN